MAIKRVLFVRVSKKSDRYPVPHLGLALLSAVLRARKHETLVLDYLLFLDKRSPHLEAIVDRFKPNVLAMSLYTSTIGESLSFIKEFRKLSVDIPVILGGPHATLYAKDLASAKAGNCIVKGEAEAVICDIVENITFDKNPVIVESPAPDLASIPIPDFTSFINYENIKVYPLQTSRGCPFRCRFCAVRHITGHKWRKRDITICSRELDIAKSYLKRLNTIKVVDDAPTIEKDRFKDFLKLFILQKSGFQLIIDNLRADSIDEEFVSLAIKAKCKSLCLGVEHADLEVFSFVNKAESLEQIRNAARLIKRERLKLGLCFIIGLPYDNFEKTLKSAYFARDLGADFIYWNMCHPMEGTELRDWFNENKGILYADNNYTSFDHHTLKVPSPVVETEDFPLWQRKKAYFAATVITDQYPLNIKEVCYLLRDSFRYHLVGLAAISLGRRILNLPKFIKRLFFIFRT